MIKCDYKRRDFKIINNNGKKHYYIRINKQFIEISYDIYKVYKNEYDRVKRSHQREFNYHTINYTDSNFISIQDSNMNIEKQILRDIEMNDKKNKLEKALKLLNSEDILIIQKIYYDKQKVVHIAKQLGISRDKLNYKRKKILLFLKDNM